LFFSKLWRVDPGEAPVEDRWLNSAVPARNAGALTRRLAELCDDLQTLVTSESRCIESDESQDAVIGFGALQPAIKTRASITVSKIRYKLPKQ
jgi:hypothetical protein